ncbi:hypothetical protein niasHS_000331 [Heterodera schachtii]|uniref:Uncharacterized protein n=1 Tax=Heterodera schachtii TaxID=97005 RepID=A0ABD2KLG4_HETSC
MSLFRRRLAIFIVLLAFFPLFCGALHCVVGLHGLDKMYKDEDVKFYDGTCDTTKYQRCYKNKCSTASGQTFLDLGCYAKDKHCDFYNKSVNAHFLKENPPSNWTCSCKFGELFKDNPYPIPSVCTYSFTADRTTFRMQPGLRDLFQKWKFDLEKTAKTCYDGAKVGCQKYRCIDEYNNDQFVFNGCAEKGQKKCSHTELDQFCNTTKCDFCEDDECNANNNELRFKKYTECKLSMDYSWLYTPSAELKKWLTNRNMENKSRTCAKRMYKCLTVTCGDAATGYPLFMFNDCAKPGEKCKTKELKKICAPPLKLNCSSCMGHKCNEAVSLPQFKPLQYFAWANCAPAAANCKPGAAKFSRRFAIGQKCEKVYNEKVWNLMGGDKGKSIYDEYENREKANDPLFLADFIRALIDDEKKAEDDKGGNEEEDE